MYITQQKILTAKLVNTQKTNQIRHKTENNNEMFYWYRVKVKSFIKFMIDERKQNNTLKASINYAKVGDNGNNFHSEFLAYTSSLFFS